MAFGHGQVRRPGVRPAWQARWWILVALNHGHFGQTDPARAAEASFEMAVSRLRRLLGHADLVRVADGQVGLDMARVWVDVAAFDLPCQRGDEASLTRALALYRAPLAGLAHTARPRLALRYAHVVGIQAQRRMRQGDAVEGAAIYRAALVQAVRCGAIGPSAGPGKPQRPAPTGLR
jgi:hypothetical protein